MQDQTTAHQALAIVGDTLELDLKLDQFLRCAITYDQVHRVDIVFEDDVAFAIRAELVEAGPANKPERLVATLAMNLSAEFERRRFGYDEQSGRIVLQSRVDASGDDPVEIAGRIAEELSFASEVADEIGRAGPRDVAAPAPQQPVEGDQAPANLIQV
ncbi:MAG: type III secretion system chaperone [Pseudomonadota bacterium]